MNNGNGSSHPREAVILGGVRTPFGKRNGQFSTWHPVEMLSFTLKGLIERTGIDPALVEDVIGGCVGQVGEQALNVTRQAWLDAGLAGVDARHDRRPSVRLGSAGHPVCRPGRHGWRL